MGRRLGREGERGKQWEPDHHADGDDGEAPPLRTGRPRRLNQANVCQGQQPGAYRTAKGDEPRIQLMDGDLRGGQRQAEGEDTKRAERGSRYSIACDNVTIATHGRR